MSSSNIYRLFYSLILSASINVAFGQDNAVVVKAKVWNKGSDKKITYSDWKDFSSTVISGLSGYASSSPDVLDLYGGNGSVIEAKGFYYVRNINGRSWVIDPLGKKFVVAAVNSIRTRKSGVLPSDMVGNTDWISSTISKLQEIGYNTAGCWSDTAAIIEYNRSGSRPIAYTVQMNLLSGYASTAKKKDEDRKENSLLSFILDDEFSDFCKKQAKKIAYLKKDPNLLGYFSDNEIPFTKNEINSILKDKSGSDKCYRALKKWLSEKGADESTVTDEQKQEFIGWVAGQYYQVVSPAIKSADPNHLYIGSRLHSTALKNSYLFTTASPFVDIFSINFYGSWEPKEEFTSSWASWSSKPFFITEFYTKAEETGMPNKSGAGWIVKSQADRGVHYQNFCLKLLKAKNCVGWHWFRYMDNDPDDATADDSNKDSNKGIVNIQYEFYQPLISAMKELNERKYDLIGFFDRN